MKTILRKEVKKKDEPNGSEQIFGRTDMKRVEAFTAAVLMVVVVFTFSLFHLVAPSNAFGESTQKVLMIPREGNSQNPDLMIKEEVGVMVKLLKSAGYEVDLATASGQPIMGPSQKIEKVLKLQEIDIEGYAGVIMPCMAVGLFPGPPVDPLAVAVVRKALSDGKPVAAALGSINVLAEAGVLKGKKYSYIRNPLKTDASWKLTDPRFADAVYLGPGTTQDGQIITCGVCPYTESIYGWGFDAYDFENGPVKLTKALIAAMEHKVGK